MKYILIIIALLCIQTSCKKTSSYSSVCNDEAKRKTDGVSGQGVGATKVKRNAYRTTTRRPHRLGLLRR